MTSESAAPESTPAQHTGAAQVAGEHGAGAGATAEPAQPTAGAQPASATARDAEIRHYIGALIDEEHRLERSHAGQALSEAERARLDHVGVELDRCWDLLRQRDARRAAGLNPDDATVRDSSVVENYRQ